MKKVPLVLWSGGLDSTYLLYSKFLNGHAVDILSVSLENNDSIQKYEVVAMERLTELFLTEESLLAEIQEHHKYKINTIPGNMYFAQPICWFFAALCVFDSTKYSSIEIAYVKGDDVWHHKHDLLEYMNTIIKIHCREKVEVLFPLEWHEKRQIIKDLQKTRLGIELLKNIRYCESPQETPCGECISCVKHEFALTCRTVI